MNATEQYRHECEVRRVAAMGPEQRKAFYEGATRHRGAAAVARLRRDVEAAQELAARAGEHA